MWPQPTFSRNELALLNTTCFSLASNKFIIAIGGVTNLNAYHERVSSKIIIYLLLCSVLIMFIQLASQLQHNNRTFQTLIIFNSHHINDPRSSRLPWTEVWEIFKDFSKNLSASIKDKVFLKLSSQTSKCQISISKSSSNNLHHPCI